MYGENYELFICCLPSGFENAQAESPIEGAGIFRISKVQSDFQEVGFQNSNILTVNSNALKTKGCRSIKKTKDALAAKKLE